MRRRKFEDYESEEEMIFEDNPESEIIETQSFQKFQ